jgi:predicted DNA binding CopG/RHH family protein
MSSQKRKSSSKPLFLAFERGELKPSPEKETELKRHREYAATTFKADQRINIRLSTRDLNALQKRALSEGVPYQTLIASILHKYVDGQFQEKRPH